MVALVEEEEGLVRVVCPSAGLTTNARAAKAPRAANIARMLYPVLKRAAGATEAPHRRFCLLSSASSVELIIRHLGCEDKTQYIAFPGTRPHTSPPQPAQATDSGLAALTPHRRAKPARLPTHRLDSRQICETIG
jgi:hypothetical protein